MRILPKIPEGFQYGGVFMKAKALICLLYTSDAADE